MVDILDIYGEVAQRQLYNIDLWRLGLTVLRDYKSTLATLELLASEYGSAASRVAVTAWKLLAVRLRISQFPGTEAEARRLIPTQSWGTCSWEKCPCHEVHPRHEMRVCKGCWVAKYCCKECQRRYGWDRFPLNT